jgi:hypothetical protein
MKKKASSRPKIRMPTRRQISYPIFQILELRDLSWGITLLKNRKQINIDFFRERYGFPQDREERGAQNN